MNTNANDRYGIAACIGNIDGMNEPEDMMTEFVRQLLSDEIAQTARMYGTYPEGYDHGMADNNNRRFEGTSYQLLEKVDGRLQATPKGARILVASGLARAMSQAYHCARAELPRGRGDPTDVRDAFESAQRMACHWLPTLWTLDAELLPDEITTDTRLDGYEERDLSEVQAQIPTPKVPS